MHLTLYALACRVWDGPYCMGLLFRRSSLLAIVALLARAATVKGFLTVGATVSRLVRPTHPVLVRMMKEHQAAALSASAHLTSKKTKKTKRRRDGVAEKQEVQEVVLSAKLTTKKKRAGAADPASAAFSTMAAEKAVSAAPAKDAVAAPLGVGSLLHTLPPLFYASVLARPSKSIKSPYLADIRLDDSGEDALCHSPSLGCMGLISEGARVMVAKVREQGWARRSMAEGFAASFESACDA